MVRLSLSFWRSYSLKLRSCSSCQEFPLYYPQEHRNDKTRSMHDVLGQDVNVSSSDISQILCLLKQCGLLESYNRVLKQVFISKQGYLDRFSSAMVAAAGGDEDFYSQIEDLKFQNGDDIEQMYKVLGG
ncbi:hypothetical protein BDV30DRAFT_230310 [Aspergillus minisclerotigenes]|uniref:Uncharacterized protein n=1 Tax=Aspergillus minisclerotigenes TaxID=656917 RepID=A0A5N6IQX6_9EURO|nr:hypothetical protein BDV30DRAFT_230310 [Aspergillus minisclerotigenes]